MDWSEDPRRTESWGTGELANIVDYLRHYRGTLELKCEGLDAEQLARRSVPPSTMSLLGLVRHLAQVEHHWFTRVLQGRDEEPQLFKTEDDRDFEFTGAVADPAVVAEAWETWRREVAAADAWLAGEVDLAVMVQLRDEQASVREILVHLVEEYARHLGHADLLRECIDGRTGQ